jgi:hypothetical protein
MQSPGAVAVGVIRRLDDSTCIRDSDTWLHPVTWTWELQVGSILMAQKEDQHGLQRQATHQPSLKPQEAHFRYLHRFASTASHQNLSGPVRTYCTVQTVV